MKIRHRKTSLYAHCHVRIGQLGPLVVTRADLELFRQILKQEKALLLVDPAS